MRRLPWAPPVTRRSSSERPASRVGQAGKRQAPRWPPTASTSIWLRWPTSRGPGRLHRAAAPRVLDRPLQGGRRRCRVRGRARVQARLADLKHFPGLGRATVDRRRARAHQRLGGDPDERSPALPGRVPPQSGPARDALDRGLPGARLAGRRLVAGIIHDLPAPQTRVHRVDDHRLARLGRRRASLSRSPRCRWRAPGPAPISC